MILSDTHFEKGGQQYRCPFYKVARTFSKADYYFEGFAGRFRRVLGYGNKYYIGEDGTVLSDKLKPVAAKLNSRDKLTVKLTYGGHSSSVYVSSLVAQAFCDFDGTWVDFRDGDPSNCAAWNLMPKKLERG